MRSLADGGRKLVRHLRNSGRGRRVVVVAALSVAAVSACAPPGIRRNTVNILKTISYSLNELQKELAITLMGRIVTETIR